MMMADMNRLDLNSVLLFCILLVVVLILFGVGVTPGKTW
jgi:hypothetical protein